MNDGKMRTLSTKRGKLTVYPDGSIDGLWRLIKRELRTAAQVRALAGGVTRKTLLNWREKHDFPAPVVTFPASARVLELYSRTQVEAWLAAWRER